MSSTVNMMSRSARIAATLGLIAALVTLVGFLTGRMTLASLLSLLREDVKPKLVGLPQMRRDLGRPPTRSIPLFAGQEGCRRLAVSPAFELACDGMPISEPLLYSDRERPHNAKLTESSPSGRYAILSLCDLDWCDDMRLVDLQGHRLISLSSASRYFPQDWIWWSAHERIALFTDMELGWYELNAIDLRTGYAADLNSFFTRAAGELYSVIPPSIKLSPDGCSIRVLYETEHDPTKRWKILQICEG